MIENLSLDEIFELESEHPPLVGNRRGTFLNPEERSVRTKVSSDDQAEGPKPQAGDPSKSVSRKTAASSEWVPNADMYTTEDGLVVEVELAGGRTEDVQVTVKGDKVTINGRRPASAHGTKVRILSEEICRGEYQKVLEIPEGYDLNQASARYENGFLRFIVPAVSRQSTSSTSAKGSGDHKSITKRVTKAVAIRG